MRPSGSFRPAAGIGAALLLATAFGCAAPDQFLRRIDEQRVTVGRGLVDIIDATDRTFGESRVEDAERIVQAKVGPELILRENDGVTIRFPIRLRAPLPALERWANVFLQFETLTEAFGTFGDFGQGFDENKAFTLSWLSKIGDHLDTGVKSRLHWSGAPQATVFPFIRWEDRLDPWRFALEQTISWDTDHGLGGATTAQADRRLGGDSYGRLSLRAGYHGELEGIDYRAVLAYRRAFIAGSYLSNEIGVDFNPHQGPTEEGAPHDPSLPVGEQDEDEAYWRTVVAGTVWRPWIEYEFGPGIHFPWTCADRLELSFRVMIRLVYEDHLRRRE